MQDPGALIGLLIMEDVIFVVGGGLLLEVVRRDEVEFVVGCMI